MTTRLGFDFFFSTRRRHTRFSRDWSSDGALPIFEVVAERGDHPEPGDNDPIVLFHAIPPWASVRTLRRSSNLAPGRLLSLARLLGLGLLEVFHRSEERRVGKECRAWGLAVHWKMR